MNNRYRWVSWETCVPYAPFVCHNNAVFFLPKVLVAYKWTQMQFSKYLRVIPCVCLWPGKRNSLVYMWMWKYHENHYHAYVRNICTYSYIRSRIAMKNTSDIENICKVSTSTVFLILYLFLCLSDVCVEWTTENMSRQKKKQWRKSQHEKCTTQIHMQTALNEGEII